MTLPVTSVGPNPQVPGIAAEAFIPDQLIAGNLKLVTKSVTLDAGNLARGSVLGEKTASPGHFILSLSAAMDGTQTPSAILADATDASGGAVVAGVYVMGEFNQDALVLGTAHTVTSIEQALRYKGIFLKNNVTATDPT